ncbi:MAG: hypothetical protein KDC80_14655 [Saprospiraceae bacterium]|nr:hypothetical protein [Saprospiraceae bacterium]
MMMTIRFLLMSMLISGSLHAMETTIVIRAKARDAKFIGSSIGGAWVIVRNAASAEILAQGKTQGSTGNTQLIMNTSWERGGRLTDDETAKFEATLDIDDPTFVTIEVISPINNRQAQVHASTQLWIIPGKHILGDGITVEIPGFVVDILEPRTHQYISLNSIENQKLQVKANMVMMCGCTISKGGIWDSEKMDVAAIIKMNGKQILEIPLGLISENLFSAEFLVDSPGMYEITVYAFDGATGNTGVDKVSYVVRD